jgi:hypothetical protein
MIGPPKLPPNWFCFSRGFACVAGAKKLRAWNLSSRLNSQAAPWIRLVPPRVTTLTTEPAFRPNSALYECVWILNSWIASGGGRITKPVLKVSLLLAPSSRKLFDWLRMPLTLKPAVAAPNPPGVASPAAPPRPPGGATTPGISVPSWVKLRPLSGSSTIFC